MISKRIVLLMFGTAVATIGLAVRGARSYAQQATAHDVPAPQSGGTVVMLCDGKTSIEVKNLKPGQMMSRAQAQAVSDGLMAKWKREHAGERWEVAQATPANAKASTATMSGDQTPAAAPSLAVQQGDTYASFQPRDYKVWKAETDKFVGEGKRIFHDAKALGSTIGISCDMCHPDAANTHPETYPKYQVQLQRVALLRDMIDWCIENPIKGKALDPNNPKLRALEAYIYAERKGVPLDYGKH
jgi:thiosulfate dehydrogenase/tetrathionate reductase SoxA/TsdA-like protein